MTLTPAQLAVVESDAPMILCSATAGAGKTKVLVTRLARLVRDGADPKRIVIITYTVSAAKVFADRMPELGPFAHIGTLHGWLFRLLSQHGDLIGLDAPLSIIDSDGERELLLDAIADMAWKGSVKDIQLEVAKGPGERLKPLTKSGLAAEAFFQRLAADKVLTFDMILHYGLVLLEAKPGISGADYLFCDEVQDLTEQDWKIIESTGIPNIFAVGDGDQRIFSFRGSSDGFEKRCKLAIRPSSRE